MRKLSLFLFFLSTSMLLVAQEGQKEQELKEFQERVNTRARKNATLIEAYKKRFGEESIIQIDDNGKITMLVGFEDNGKPIFFETHNSDAAESVSTDHVHLGGGFGYSLDGDGIDIGEWDGGAVRATHVELANRITQVDNPSSNSDHATHVAGTMIATGIDVGAKGMANQATISAHDFFNDLSEMTTYSQGTNTILSNHSYGSITGWRYNSSIGYWEWWGDTALSQTEDYRFGFYNGRTEDWDDLARLAPNYLMVKSAGNDRNDNIATSAQDTHFVWSDVTNSWELSTVIRAADCSTGYDCISSYGTAKNILTVGAVGDISGGYSQPSDVNMSSFSGWGPTDDGRIKPDIVGNGVSLYSTGSSNNTDYYNSNGTSMSAPNVTGSLALIQEHYNNKYSSFMRSSTLKGLVLHTADEAGSAVGPDYEHGWGMLNTLKAVQLLDDTAGAIVKLDTISTGDSITYSFYYDGVTPLRATICWTDPAATPNPISLNPTTIKLVNDLDLRATHIVSGQMNMPYTLNPANPSAAATTGDNIRDNVEQVYVATPTAGMYSFTIKHKGTITGGPQEVSVIIEGFTTVPAGVVPVADFSVSDTLVCVGDQVTLTDLSTNNPTSWSWEVTDGSNTTTFATQNPIFTNGQPGIYDVTLVASNANGSDTIVEIGAFEIDSIPNVVFDIDSEICLDAGSIPLNPFTNYPGGTYSGNGVVGNFFVPIAAGLGSHVITYTYTTPGGCSVTTTDTTSVEDSVSVSHVAIPPICLGSAPLTLIGGTPVGGVYSGSGVINGVFFSDSVGVGNHSITYSFTNAGGCTDTVQVPIVVTVGTTPTLSPLPDACSNEAPFTLTGGTPSGGIYTGAGVDSLTGIFNPASVGAGTYLLTYTSNSGGCVAGDTASITVVDPVSVTLNLGFGAVCTGASPITLSGGSPLGGTFSGNGVANGVFDPSVSGMGTHTVYYSVVDSNGCNAVDSQQVVVSGSVNVSITDSSDICSDLAAFTLTNGSPLGGTYSGPGIVNNVFTPSNAGAGAHVIYYTYDTNGCAGMDSAVFTVVQAPEVIFDPLLPVCIGVDSLALTASPVGGIFSGTGVSGNFFYPDSAGLGVHTISYMVQDAIGCNTTEDQDIEVTSGVTSLTGLDSSYCENDAPVTLVGSPNGGVLLGNGIVGSSFDPSIAGAGPHVISYATSGECADTASLDVTVEVAPVAVMISGAPTAFQGETFTYSISSSNGTAVTWQVTGGTIVNTLNNIVTVEWGAGAVGQLVAVQTVGNCSANSTFDVSLWPVGVADNVESSQVMLYPNPASSIAILQVSEELEYVKLVDLRGAEVENVFSVDGGKAEGDISTVSKGTYMVLYKTRSGDEGVLKLIRR